MRLIKGRDVDGFLKNFLIRDTDAESEADSIGIPVGPPSFSGLDLKQMAIEMETMLAERGIHSWDDVRRGQNVVSSVVSAVYRKHITMLYRINS